MGKQFEPLVSVVVPVFNVEDLLSRCIDSILEQSYSNLDIILVDDGSTDSSGDICDFYAGKDTRIRVIHKANEGLSMARNSAMKLVKGEYVLFVDSDDFLGIFHIERLLNAFNSCAVTSGVAITGFTEVSAASNRNRSGFIVKSDKCIKLSKEESLCELVVPKGRFASFACGKLYSKDLFECLYYPPGKCFEDQFVTYRVLLCAANIFYEDADDYFYTLDRSQSISNASKTNRLDYLEAIRIMDDDPELKAIKKVHKAVHLRYLLTLADVAMITAKYSEKNIFLEVFDELISQRKSTEIPSLPLKARIIYLLSYFGKSIFQLVAKAFYR